MLSSSLQSTAMKPDDRRKVFLPDRIVNIEFATLFTVTVRFPAGIYEMSFTVLYVSCACKVKPINRRMNDKYFLMLLSVCELLGQIYYNNDTV